jgi:hypothetical protein
MPARGASPSIAVMRVTVAMPALIWSASAATVTERQPAAVKTLAVYLMVIMVYP